MGQNLKLHEPLAREYESLSRNELRKRLSEFIYELLVYNPEKLANIIYRHDVKESLFERALLMGDTAEQSIAIADLVIEREMEKVEMRKAYRKYKEEKKKLK